VSRAEVAAAALQPGKLPSGIEPGLFESGVFAPEDNTYPYGTHSCEVAVDPETGVVTLVRYVVADDVGIVINPPIVKGQIHGGIGQGAGQALMERIVYDRASGQLITASFMDYAMPRADDFCDIEIKSLVVPTPRNPLGVKGAGEAGAVGALPVVINAIIDARSARRHAPRDAGDAGARVGGDSGGAASLRERRIADPRRPTAAVTTTVDIDLLMASKLW
jgi:carbon-monoxide dehydrogenase large subunit